MIHDRLVEAGSVQLAVRDFGGERAPLVLLHGAGGNLAQMTTLARALREGFRVVTMDLRGHGRSADGDWSWDAALGDLAAVCVELALDRPAIVGDGLGGMVAALWGQRHPESPGVVSLDGNPPPSRVEQLPGMDPEKAAAELARLESAFDVIEASAGADIPADELADLVERQRMAARDMGANEKVWIEGFRRNLVHTREGRTSVRPSAWTTSQLRELIGGLDLGPVYAATTCPELVVLPTRNAPEQESFGELYTAYRDHLVEQVRTAGRLRYLSLADASSAMVIEQPAALASVITGFLTGER
ncbi:alpha/beta hydrolase [Actinoplanes sp. NPDC051851]|uniref:alpha/beta fold hydrolase n=1 Tax=Actinoplanes sp. NPDC051851 TaxID=3154753 RepID=UPI003426142E